MPILNWPDIVISSPEYNFLKDIGVKEFPALNLLVERIITEHNEKYKDLKIEGDYEVPKALEFLIIHFQVAYAIDWTQKSFSAKKIFPTYLPKSLMKKTTESYVILSAADESSSVENPLFAYILPKVKDLIEKYSNLKSIGISEHPAVSVAFDVLMQRRDDILSDETAPRIFSYINRLGHIDPKLKNRIHDCSCIPLRGILNNFGIINVTNYILTYVI